MCRSPSPHRSQEVILPYFGCGRARSDFVARQAGRERLWRRWTGIEPAGRGSPVPAALKAVEPTRCPDTSTVDPSGPLLPSSMAKFVKLLLVVVVIGAVVYVIQQKRAV
jgi:hypothetical protein